MRINVLDRLLRLLAATSLGVSVGTMLTGELLLVPYWRSLAPAEFLAWFGANAPRMLSFYGPLQSVNAVLAIVAAIASMSAGTSGRQLSVLAAILAIGVFVPYFLYFQRANASFAALTIATNDVPTEMARYAVWQWARIGLGFGAFPSSLLALTRFI